jgi:hypothetical protein
LARDSDGSSRKRDRGGGRARFFRRGTFEFFGRRPLVGVFFLLGVAQPLVRGFQERSCQVQSAALPVGFRILAESFRVGKLFIPVDALDLGKLLAVWQK